MTLKEENENKQAILKILKNANGFVTKEQISLALGLQERTVRRIISNISKTLPIISYSTTKGYKLAKGKDDFSDVVHTILEIESRIDELKERKVQLMKYYEKYGRGGREK